MVQHVGYCCLGSSVVKNPSANAGDASSVPGSERSTGGGIGNPLQYSCLDNPMDRGAWWTTVHGVARVRHDLVTEPHTRGILLGSNLQFQTMNCISF